MPFVTVKRLPEDASTNQLLQLRRDIVETVHREMGVKREHVGVNMPSDLIDAPLVSEDGANTIQIELLTGLFATRNNANELAPRVTKALATLVAKTFDGAFEAECFVIEVTPGWTSLVEAE